MKKAFTLIELLIVVAIIAILAAIAVPNFLEAQVRSKVSRVMADVRTIGIAINSYYIDANHNPPGFTTEGVYNTPDNSHRNWCYKFMTTPVAYLSSLPEDPFNPVEAGRPESKNYYYNDLMDPVWKHNPSANTSNAAVQPIVEQSGYTWSLYSTGPQRVEINSPNVEHIIADFHGATGDKDKDLATIYDPTNGTVSRGRIFYTSKGFWNNGVM